VHKCACKCEPGMCVYEDVHIHVKENTFLCVHAQCVFIFTSASVESLYKKLFQIQYFYF
jgi:hypothetical protein